MRQSQPRTDKRYSRRSPAILALIVVVAPVMLTGCGGKDDAAAGKPRGRPPAKVRVDYVAEGKLAPRVVAVGTLTAVRTSTIASGANGVVEKYDAEEGQWVKVGTVLSELRMKSSQQQVQEAEQLLKLREEETKESQSSRVEEIKAAEFRKKAAETAMKIAKLRYDRAVAASKQGAINEEDLDEARQRHEQTLAMFQEAEQNHKLIKDGPREEKKMQAKARENAQAANLGYLQAEHEKRTTKAPFSGYIVKEHTYIGQWLSKGDPVVTLAKLDYMDVVVNVDQTDIRQVQLGQTADVEVQGFPLERIDVTSPRKEQIDALIESETPATIELIDGNGKRRTIPKSAIASRQRTAWKGRIVHIVPRSEWKTGARGFPVKVRIANRIRTVTIPAAKDGGNPTNRDVPVLKEGMMVNVTFQGPKQTVLLVHTDALIRSTHGMLVNVFQPAKDNPKKGSTFQIGVRTGISEGNLIQITAKPTNEGETIKFVPNETQVVIEGGERLMPVHGEVIVVEKETSKKAKSK